MDHSHHMHGDMDMGGGHMGHGGMDMGGGQCNMNMLFTWSYKDLCIVFPSWHVKGPVSLIFSLVFVVILTAGYEGIREVTRRYEAAQTRRLVAFTVTTNGSNEVADESATANIPNPETNHLPDASSPLLVGRDNRRAVERRGKITMAALYAVQVFYSFFIMLLFMTYNGSVMLAVAVGAFVGYLAFGQSTSAAKSVACH